MASKLFTIPARLLLGRSFENLERANTHFSAPIVDRSGVGERFAAEQKRLAPFLTKRWGYVNLPYDAVVLLKALERFKGAARVTMAELGVAEGHTGSRLVEYVRSLGVADVRYYGIDTQALLGRPPAFDSPEQMTFLQQGRAAFDTLRDLDFCFVDACHCAECVYADSVAASRSVRIGGVMVFHDTSMAGQFPQSAMGRHDWQHYGSETDAKRPLAVIEGITLGRSQWAGSWRLVDQSGDHLDWGGVRVYERVG
jgi:hypothetical protein